MLLCTDRYRLSWVCKDIVVVVIDGNLPLSFTLVRCSKIIFMSRPQWCSDLIYFSYQYIDMRFLSATRFTIISIAIALFISWSGLIHVNQAIALPTTKPLTLPAKHQIVSTPIPRSLGNITSTVKVFPALIQALKTQLHTSLLVAVTNAMNATGPNSTPIAGSIQQERGFLVYRVFVIDANNTIHTVLIDPGNGKVLSSQQLPAGIMSGMMTGLSPNPLVSSPFGGSGR